jgi:PPK2 family polyphosphate:nucleotide phosphotransferase
MFKAGALSKPFKVTSGDKFRLKDVDPGSTRGVKSKAQAEEMLEQGTERLRLLQDKLYAMDQWALLLIFQAMDAAGKDGAIKHVMSGVNPQSCQVYSFKAPSAQDLDHDFMWRTNQCLPERGRVGIFNRSYYEETLVVRVHSNLLEAEKLPPDVRTKHIWQERFRDITAFERYASSNGIVIRKFFLHLSREEQKRRFLARLDDPNKNWKFSLADVRERRHWDEYMHAYEDMIRHTSTPFAPWYTVPADNKWYTRLIVAAAVIDALEDMNLAYPIVGKARQQELAEARAALESESE